MQKVQEIGKVLVQANSKLDSQRSTLNSFPADLQVQDFPVKPGAQQQEMPVQPAPVQPAPVQPEPVPAVPQALPQAWPRPKPTAPDMWPEPLAEDAFIGPAGKFANLLKPHTVADPAGILLSLLTGFGSMVGGFGEALGNRPYAPLIPGGSAKQYTSLYTALIGDTSEGYKRTAVNEVLDFLKKVDPSFFKDSNFQAGLDTTEGLISMFPDPQPDKRLLFYLQEFTKQLKLLPVASLGETLCEAWDGGLIGKGSQTNRATVTHPAVAIIANTVPEKLCRRLKRDDSIEDGLGNRFLWIMVRQSQVLSRITKPLDQDEYDYLVVVFQEALKKAMERELLVLDAEADQAWDSIYAAVSPQGKGSYRSMTTRGVPNVVRLALVYALLDESKFIQLNHLKAAVEIWRYNEDSVMYLYKGEGKAQMTREMLAAEKIENELRDKRVLEGTSINRLFSSHKEWTRILPRALALLVEAGKIKVSKGTSEGGRPPTYIEWLGD